MSSKRKLFKTANRKSGIKKYDNSQRSQSQPSIHQFLKKSKKQNQKIPTITTAANTVQKISPYTSPYQNLKQCPVCCKKLNGFTAAHRDVHVNMCLDIAFNAPTIDININNTNHNNSNNNNNNNNNQNTNNSTNNPNSVTIPKYVKKSLDFHALKQSKSTSPVNGCNNYWNRKKKRKNKLHRYYTSAVTNTQTIRKQTKKEYYHEYKILDHSNIIIDGFSNAIKFAPDKAIYFLTHFHSDHYKGLTNKFNAGLVYCSEITSRLIYSQIGVCSNIIRPLPMYTKCEIENSNPLSFVTLLDANHCPGAVMLLFEMHLTDNSIKYHLHMGDARCEFETNSLFYQSNYNILSKYYGKIDKLYLDSTYLESQIDLPRQSDAIQFIANKCKMYLNDYNNDLLILIGTYSIGKERVLQQVARQCNKQIFVTNNKQNIFNAVYGQTDENIFTNDDKATNIYVVGMNEISFKTMWRYKTKYTKIIGFRPTGWASNKHKKTQNKHVIYPIYSEANNIHSMVIYEVAYSEHSSFMELCKFVHDIKPKQIIPTVGNTSVNKVKSQLRILNQYKDKIKYEYYSLCESNDLKQTTLENYNFSTLQAIK